MIDRHKVFDAIGDGISIHGTDFELLDANEALCGVLGVSKKDIIGKKCYQVFHGLDCPKKDCPMEKSKISKKVEKIEYFEPKLKVWVSVTTSPVLNSKGEVESFVHLVQDISVRKKAEEELKVKMEQLEKFNKISVGRELRMKELKKEIEGLRAKLDEH